MVVKLLVTYFEHNRPREVLELMSKILQFSGTVRPRVSVGGVQIMSHKKPRQAWRLPFHRISFYQINVLVGSSQNDSFTVFMNQISTPNACVCLLQSSVISVSPLAVDEKSKCGLGAGAAANSKTKQAMAQASRVAGWVRCES